MQRQLQQDFENTNRNIEQDITVRQENIQTQRDLASKGLENTLQFEETKLAEARINQQKELERQQKIEEVIQLTQAYFAAFNARVGENPNTAPVLALKDVLLAKGVATGIKALVGGFHDGGYTGDGNEYDVAGVVHKQEHVITDAQTDKYDMKGWTAQDFDNKMKAGYFNQFSDIGNNMLFTPVINVDAKPAKQNIDTNYLVVQALKEVENTIKNQPRQQFDIDALGNLVETSYKNGIKTVTTLMKKWL